MRNLFGRLGFLMVLGVALAACGGGGGGDGQTTRCGDGVCSASTENSTSCPSDCGAGPVCSDGVCNGTETSASCPADCPSAPVCGDGSCTGDERASNCEADCPSVCGDNACTHDETPVTCEQDCTSAATCGDGTCDASESASTCADDCMAVCGDGACTHDEDDKNCPQDCSVSTDCSMECSEGIYAACSCSAADPCGWVGDDYCDDACATQFPEDHFDDALDCEGGGGGGACEGACEAGEYTACTCGSDDPCGWVGDDYCDDECATLFPENYFDDALDCEGGGGGGGACEGSCEAGEYTACTCGSADPCSWQNDGICDDMCATAFPEDYFDDTFDCVDAARSTHKPAR